MDNYNIQNYDDLDNDTLMVTISKLEQEIQTKKRDLDDAIIKSDEFNYLQVAIARLAYEFKKEEYHNLMCKVKSYK